MAQAIAILSSPDAKATFKNATTTFLQISSRRGEEGGDRAKAYNRVKALASTYKSLGLAKLAVAIKTSGHFDAIITTIDNMIAMMRKEEQEDIMHRDRCDAKQNANQNGMDDLNREITKAKERIARLGNNEDELKKNLKAIED